jgi:hypothetical protein
MAPFRTDRVPTRCNLPVLPRSQDGYGYGKMAANKLLFIFFRILPSGASFIYSIKKLIRITAR